MGAQQLNLWQFLLVYLLVLVMLLVFQKQKLDQTKLLLIASIRMTVQLVLAGLILQLIFQYPHPIFTVAYFTVILLFAIHRMLAGCRCLNWKFRLAAALSLTGVGLLILFFFVCAVIGQSFFDPQYTITLSGMIIGNAMTGVSLSLRVFTDDLLQRRSELHCLLNAGVYPKRILHPLVSHALSSSLLPTLNSMLGMGIIFLPGMMTGQILSGTLPTTAILYQIAVMLCVCTSVCLASFFTLYFGSKTLYNEQLQLCLPVISNQKK